MFDAQGRRVLPGEGVVGVWARGIDLAALTPAGQEAAPPAAFVEWSEWDVQHGWLE